MSRERSALVYSWSASRSPWLMSSELKLVCVAGVAWVIKALSRAVMLIVGAPFHLPLMETSRRRRHSACSTPPIPWKDINYWSMVSQFSFFATPCLMVVRWLPRSKNAVILSVRSPTWVFSVAVCRRRFFLPRYRSRCWQRVMAVQYSYWGIATYDDCLTVGTSGTRKMSVTSLQTIVDKPSLLAIFLILDRGRRQSLGWCLSPS